MNFTKEMKEYLEEVFSDSKLEFYCDYDDPPENPKFPFVNITQVMTTTDESKKGKDVVTNVTIQIHVVSDRCVIDDEIHTPRSAVITYGDAVLDKFREKFGFKLTDVPPPYPSRPTSPDIWTRTYRLTAKYYDGYFWKN